VVVYEERISPKLKSHQTQLLGVPGGIVVKKEGTGSQRVGMGNDVDVIESEVRVHGFNTPQHRIEHPSKSRPGSHVPRIQLERNVRRMGVSRPLA